MRRSLVGRLALVGLGVPLLAAAGCKKLNPPTPLAQLNEQQVRGYQAFHTYCAQCHTDRVNQPLNGPSLRGIFQKQYLDSGAPANDDRVLGTILYGRAMMPALGRSISPQEREDILAYLHTL